MAGISASLPIGHSYPAPGLGIGNPVHGAVDAVKHGVHWLDEYTSPRPGTHGNLEKPSLFQAAFNGGADGFYLLGPVGIVTGAASAGLGVIIQESTHNQALGVAAGTVAGAVMGGVAASMVGSPLGVALGAVSGGLMGAFQTYRGHSESETRDCGNATLISAFFVPGPAKMAAGLAAMVGASNAEKPLTKALIGGALGTALGVGLAACGLSHAGMLTAGLASGLAGAVGPFFGRRFSQLFRNLAEDIGNGLDKLGQKTHVIQDGQVSDKFLKTIGSIPASFAKEGLRAFLYSDGSIPVLVMGGVKECIRQIHIVWNRRDDEVTPTTPPATAPAPQSTPPATAPAPQSTPPATAPAPQSTAA